MTYVHGSVKIHFNQLHIVLCVFCSHLPNIQKRILYSKSQEDDINIEWRVLDCGQFSRGEGVGVVGEEDSSEIEKGNLKI